MSGGPVRIEIEIEGLELLADALVNAPETVDRALSQAGQETLGILGPAVDLFTPVDTGFLLSNNEFRLEGVFAVVYSNFTEYASFVETNQHYVERAVESVEGVLERVYDDAMDDVARTFGSGR